MIKHRLLFLPICLLFSIHTHANNIIGDIDGDGALTIADVTLLASMLLSGQDGNGASPEADYVDLGLTSGTLWATWNLGAESADDYGSYFAWGDTTGYSSDHSFDWAHYPLLQEDKTTWHYISKYTVPDEVTSASWYEDGEFVGDGFTQLMPEDDAATVQWGALWCLPTHAQQLELAEECTWTFREFADVTGYEVKGPNGNSIFLPASGYCSGTSTVNKGFIGGYWSSEIYAEGGTYMAYVIGFSPNTHSARQASNRVFGRSIRPVISRVDVNHDGRVTILDVSLLISQLSKRYVVFPETNDLSIPQE